MPGAGDVFRSECFAVDFQAAANASSRLAITFTERGHDNLDTPGFGTQYLLDLGCDVLAVKTKSNTWYQDMPDQLLPAVTTFLSSLPTDYETRLCYGSSMGGFAAIRFAKLFRATIVVALSPQFDVTRRWDTRWSVALPEGRSFECFAGADVAANCKYVIAFDPKDQDVLHFQKFAEIIPLAQCEAVAVSHAGHPAGPFLNKTGALNKIIVAALHGGPLPNVTMTVRRGRNSFPDYYFNLAATCLKFGKVRWAEALLVQAMALDPLNAEYHIRAAHVADVQGQLDKAISLAATSVAVNPTHPHMAALLADLLSRRKLLAQALHQIDRAIALAPDWQGFQVQREAILQAAQS